MSGGDGRGHGQSFGGGLPLGEFNKQIPPGWRPGIPDYPIKLYFERLRLWYRVAENAEARLGVFVAGRLQCVPQKIAIRLRLPRPVAAGGGYEIGDEALIRLSQAQLTDPATGTIVQEYIPSGLQRLCQELRSIYGLQDQDKTTVALDSFYEFRRGHLPLAEYAQEFDHCYECAEDEAGLHMNDTGKAYFFLRGSGLGDKVVDDIKLQMLGDTSKHNEIRSLVLKLARANDKDKESLNMYQGSSDFIYKLRLDEASGIYYGSRHDPTSGDLIDYWYGEDGWQNEMYCGDDDWQWQPQPSSSTTAATEDNAIETDENCWGKFGGKCKGKGKSKSLGAKGKGPSGGSASGTGCMTCSSRWHSSLDCPLNDQKGDSGKGHGEGKDFHCENFWKGKSKGKKGKGFGKSYGKYRPYKGYGGGFGKGKYGGYGKSFGKGKFKGGYGGFLNSSYNSTTFQDETSALQSGSGAQYHDLDNDEPSSSTAPPQDRQPLVDADGNFGYDDGYGEFDTAPVPPPADRVNSLSFLVGMCSAFPTDNDDRSTLCHSVRGVKRHGLLIDPGLRRA
ncbi:unnamed protein product, partial [Polarella glacialis]